MENCFHSIRLDKEKCAGCTNCMKQCPTQAIRIRDEKAYIISERCIDCGKCIKICPYHAKYAVSKPMDLMLNYKYKAAIPDIAFYGQFKSKEEISRALGALKYIGFDYVFEAEKAIEAIAISTGQVLKNSKVKPMISSLCPTVTRLIQLRFHELIENIVKVNLPMEVAGKIAKDTIIKEKNAKPEEIGVFYISPCAAQITQTVYPIGTEKSYVDAVLPMKEIYKIIYPLMKSDSLKIEESSTLKEGIKLIPMDYQCYFEGTKECISVDGVDNVITVLEEVENGKFDNIDYLELHACNCGCVGGPLSVENSYIAKKRIQKLVPEVNEEKNYLNHESINFEWEKTPQHIPALKLDTDVSGAIQKMNEMSKILKLLPGLDCGSCGAPTCRALAEDIVKNNAKIFDCKFRKKRENQLTIDN